MKIPEASQVLRQYRRDGEPHDLTDFEQAVDLAIESLRYIYTIRQADPGHSPGPLPGETDE